MLQDFPKAGKSTGNVQEFPGSVGTLSKPLVS